ncbi:alpha/beta hydrolase [Catellatospora sp. NPDC049609]|uniref:alpha/beta fold hydrolase n=1 Tax=Catellatospora sp. NPDC049609 TaxID=3155505 RepID=UPI0034194EBA
MKSAPIILVPGFWLGAWAWDEVAAALRAGGHQVTALTLPGLDAPGTDRSAITMAAHVDAIVAAVEAAGRPVVLAVHSGAGAPGYGATDRVPERIAAMVYVDSGPVRGALEPGFTGVESPPPDWSGPDADAPALTVEQLDRFRRLALPQPGAALREAAPLADPARLAVPTTVICTSMPSSEIKDAARRGLPFVGGLSELHDVTYLDLPTHHWPMWSRPDDLAAILASLAVASAAGR